MRQFYIKMAAAYFTTATLFLMFLAILLLLAAALEVVEALSQGVEVQRLLDSVGLLIIGFAIIETSKFIAEEEVLREKELRSARESRRSLTKFITIIVIAASLEALVMVFKASRTDLSDSLYASALFMASMGALVALGLYQWFSSRIADGSTADESKGTE